MVEVCVTELVMVVDGLLVAVVDTLEETPLLCSGVQVREGDGDGVPDHCDLDGDDDGVTVADSVTELVLDELIDLITYSDAMTLGVMYGISPDGANRGDGEIDEEISCGLRMVVVDGLTVPGSAFVDSATTTEGDSMITLKPPSSSSSY